MRNSTRGTTRHGAIAALYQTSPATISRHIGDIRRLLAQTGNTITPAARKLTTLDDLYQYAAGHGITIPAKPNQRVNN